MLTSCFGVIHDFSTGDSPCCSIIIFINFLQEAYTFHEHCYICIKHFKSYVFADVVVEQHVALA
uniref:Uncharacterized protein n=1 Tax=Arundo donax TaxID=35708 RepID=A0A0A8Y460_ARUDO